MKTRTTNMKRCPKFHLGVPSTSHFFPPWLFFAVFPCQHVAPSAYVCEPVTESHLWLLSLLYFPHPDDFFSEHILNLSLSVPLCFPHPGSTKNPIHPQSAFTASCLELPGCSSSSYQLFNSHTFVLCIQNDL